MLFETPRIVLAYIYDAKKERQTNVSMVHTSLVTYPAFTWPAHCEHNQLLIHQTMEVKIRWRNKKRTGDFESARQYGRAQQIDTTFTTTIPATLPPQPCPPVPLSNDNNCLLNMLRCISYPPCPEIHLTTYPLKTLGIVSDFCNQSLCRPGSEVTICDQP